MPISLDFDAVTQADTEQAQAVIATTIEEEVPGINATQGVLHDIVVGLLGLTLASMENAAENQLASGSLAAVVANPSLADTATVDAIVSNFNLTRTSAKQATGQVKIIVSSPTPINLPVNVGFLSAGRRYATPSSFALRAPGATLLTSTDRVLVSIGQGRYAASVAVVADVAGISPVKSGDVMSPDVAISNFVSAFADSDFTDGQAAETNEQLLAKIPTAIAGKMASAAPSIANLIHDKFPSVVAVSVISYGDAEMRRHHALFPGGSGSRYDIYVRSAALPTSTPVTVTATRVSSGGTAGLWQCGITRDVAPAWYDVTDILAVTADPADTTGVEPAADTRGVDLSGSGFRPDLISGTEAAYTPFQTAALRFSGTTGAIGETADYIVTLRRMPIIKDISDYVTGNEVRARGSDILVKAATPCDTEVNILITATNGAVVDTESLKVSVANWINYQGFTGRLPATAIAAAITPELPTGTIISRVWVRGTIRCEDGSRVTAGGPHELLVPYAPEIGVTSRTVCFFADPVDITISVQTE